MRTELLKELKNAILNKIGIDFDEVIFEPYPEPDDDDWMGDDYELEEVFNKDGVVATIEWELGDVFISGLTEDEIKYIKQGKE